MRKLKQFGMDGFSELISNGRSVSDLDYIVLEKIGPNLDSLRQLYRS
jgi:hypothetical protein